MTRTTPYIMGYLGNLRCGDRDPVRIMGVINLTKNSFYEGSVVKTDDEILGTATSMESDGADIIDLGARSTAPYRKSEISVETEKRLLRNATKLIASKIRIPVSADTTRIEPAKAAFSEGASILNDVYGFTQRDSSKIAQLVSKKGASLLTTAHESKRFSSEQSGPIERISSCLDKSVEFAIRHGIDREKIVVDPGIGFFFDDKISNSEWNTQIISDLAYLRRFNLPVCVGVSRKKFIGQILGEKPPEDRLIGSLGAAAICVYNGAHLVRTHDVRETLEVAKVALAIRRRGQ